MFGQKGWSAEVPATEAGKVGFFTICIAPRPHYCDRGQFLVHIFAHGVLDLDGQESFPRYYFELETAKREMELWVNKRQACLEAAKELV